MHGSLMGNIVIRGVDILVSKKQTRKFAQNVTSEIHNLFPVAYAWNLAKKGNGIGAEKVLEHTTTDYMHNPSHRRLLAIGYYRQAKELYDFVRIDNIINNVLMGTTGRPGMLLLGTEHSNAYQLQPLSHEIEILGISAGVCLRRARAFDEATVVRLESQKPKK